MRGLSIVLAFAALLLVATNPSRAEFNTWAQNWVVKKIEDEARRRGENPNDGASQLGGTIAGIFLPHLPIERQNFLAFSIYSLDLPEGDSEKTCNVLGVAGQFVPLGEC
jgi:hypothetical protein